MLKKITHTFALLALGFTLATPAAVAAPISGNTNHSVTVEMLDELEVKYKVEDNGEIVFMVDGDCLVVIDADDEKNVFSIIAFKKLGISEENRAKALVIINKLNEDYGLKFWIDEDGDLMSQVVFDTDDMVISKKCAAASLRRILAGLEIAGEELSSLAQ